MSHGSRNEKRPCLQTIHLKMTTAFQAHTFDCAKHDYEIEVNSQSMETPQRELFSCQSKLCVSVCLPHGKTNMNYWVNVHLEYTLVVGNRWFVV